VEEEISRTIGAVTRSNEDIKDGYDHDYKTRADGYPLFSIGDIPLFNIGDKLKKMIGSVKVRSVSRRISQVEVEDLPQAKTFQSKGRHSSITPEDISERWQIGLVQAKETLKRMVQRLWRLAVMPLARRYRADRMFERKRLRGTWSSDTMDGRVKSIDRNRYAQVFANGSFFAEIYPMATKAMAGMALKEFITELSVPDEMTIDGSKEQNSRGIQTVTRPLLLQMPLPRTCLRRLT
jgi:hypothetical protein